jgi:hypothetical protein
VAEIEGIEANVRKHQKKGLNEKEKRRRRRGRRIRY